MKFFIIAFGFPFLYMIFLTLYIFRGTRKVRKEKKAIKSCIEQIKLK